MLEIGPGHGTLALGAIEAGWRYRAIEASAILIDELRAKGLDVTGGLGAADPAPDASADVVYADQVLEHMSGIDAARQFVAEARRVLRPGGTFFVVVPDYLKERTFFWDVDYTHNFVTTERRVTQLLHDGGFDLRAVVRSIGAATGVKRDLLAAAAMFDQRAGLEHVVAPDRHVEPAVQDPQEPLRNHRVRRPEADRVIAKLTRSLWVRALLTVAVLALLVSRIDLRDSAAALGRLNLPLAGLVLLLVAADRVDHDLALDHSAARARHRHLGVQRGDRFTW